MAGGVDGGGDPFNRLLPPDGLECSRTLGAVPQERGFQPSGMIGALKIAADLRAEESTGEGVVRIAAQVSGDTSLDGDEHAASVRAIMRANAPDRARVRDGQGSHAITATKASENRKGVPNMGEHPSLEVAFRNKAVRFPECRWGRGE